VAKEVAITAITPIEITKLTRPAIVKQFALTRSVQRFATVPIREQTIKLNTTNRMGFIFFALKMK
jgi:precorrin-4 methylase